MKFYKTQQSIFPSRREWRNVFFWTPAFPSNNETLSRLCWNNAPFHPCSYLGIEKPSAKKSTQKRPIHSSCWRSRQKDFSKTHNSRRSMRNELWGPRGHCAKKKLFLIDFNYSIITIRRISLLFRRSLRVRFGIRSRSLPLPSLWRICPCRYSSSSSSRHMSVPDCDAMRIVVVIAARCSLRKQLIDQTSWESIRRVRYKGREVLGWPWCSSSQQPISQPTQHQLVEFIFPIFVNCYSNRMMCFFLLSLVGTIVPFKWFKSSRMMMTTTTMMIAHNAIHIWERASKRRVARNTIETIETRFHSCLEYLKKHKN